MQDVIIRAYTNGGVRELLALIPVPDDVNATDGQLIALAMIALREQGRFADTEIETFQYRLDRPRASTLQTPFPRRLQAL
ncbi:hypothetical protein [Shinella sp.]|uniref:hypothetical protein n=1 Tax=Shinella sp. TaxID=1870904 RepID=UPI003F6F4956